MSMIADMTKEMQDLRDEHKQQMDQIKGVSRNAPTDNILWCQTTNSPIRA